MALFPTRVFTKGLLRKRSTWVCGKSPSENHRPFDWFLQSGPQKADTAKADAVIRCGEVPT